MLAPSRWAPPAASQVWEISASSEAPEGTSPVPTSATPVPKRQLCWELGKGASSAFPVAQLSPKQLPSRSSMPRDAGRPGRSCTPAGGAARGGDSPPRAALGAGVSDWGSEAPRRRRGAEVAAGAGTAHGPRGSPVRGAALAPARAAEGAALSRRRALWPSTGDLRLGGPTPASRFARPGGTPPAPPRHLHAVTSHCTPLLRF